MKAEIHPEYHTDAEAKCACGATHKLGSTKENIRVEVCSSCHPFYTGTEKVMDATGRVERFKARSAAAKKAVADKKAARTKSGK